MRTALWPRGVLLVLFLLGCGDDDSGSQPLDGAAPPTLDGLCLALSERVCRGLRECGCRFDVRAYEADGCVSARRADCMASTGARLSPDLQAGHARLDAAAVTACLDAVAALASSCTLATGPGAPLPAACNAFVVATANIGEVCRISGGGLAFCGEAGVGVCVPGPGDQARCTALPSEGASCLGGLCAAGLACGGDGTCVAPGEMNAPCSSASTCSAGLTCGPSQTCIARLGERQPCNAPDQCDRGLVCHDGTCTGLAPLGAGCEDSPRCGADRACGRAPETRTCLPRGAAGAPCSTNQQTCAPGLVCAGDTPRCVALPTDGEACLDGFHCAEGLTCLDGAATCAPLPTQGQACAVGARTCVEGLGCRPSDSTCQPGPGVGEDCYLNPPDYLCADGLGCDFGATGSTCRAPTAAGTACNTDRTCTPETYCDLSTLRCTPRLADGMPCSDGNECLAGQECALVPGGPRCAPLPALDEPCVFDCAGDLACQGPGGECVPQFCTIPG